MQIIHLFYLVIVYTGIRGRLREPVNKGEYEKHLGSTTAMA
jgi:hypothetical protein